MIEEDSPVSNTSAKGSFAESAARRHRPELPMIRPIAASAAGDDLFWWPQQVIFNPDKAVRRDGAPQQFNSEPETAFFLEAPWRPSPPSLAALGAVSRRRPGKGDMLVVNRDGKASLPVGIRPARQSKLSQAEAN